MEGDGLPNQICTQCLQMVNRAYAFRQQCEKSDNSLHQYINSLNLEAATLHNNQQMIQPVKNDHLFPSNEVLQQASIFNDIFNDDHAHSLVDNFTSENTGSNIHAYSIHMYVYKVKVGI